MQSPPVNTDNLQASSVDYESLYRNLKEEVQIDRHRILNDLMRSIATINDALAHIIGELGGGRL
jgi:hypothetical protein